MSGYYGRPLEPLPDDWSARIDAINELDRRDEEAAEAEAWRWGHEEDRTLRQVIRDQVAATTPRRAA